MPIGNAEKTKIKDFLKINLGTLRGKQLSEFMEKYGIREANRTEMMLLDYGAPGKFMAFRNEQNPETYFVATEDMVEKILFLETLDPDSTIQDQNK